MAWCNLKPVQATIIIFLLLFQLASARYYDDQCCSSARSASAFVPAPTQPPICGQEYNQSIPAAPNANVPYPFCKKNCDGFGLSQWHKPSQWAAPIVQFILPSVIFSMTIPRRRIFSLSVRSIPTRLSTIRPIFAPLIRLPIVAFDNIAWIAIILALAGPMMISGLYEAVLDWRILTVLLNHRIHNDEVIELLVTIVSGNLVRNSDIRTQPHPQVEITNALINSDRDQRRARLLGPMTSQYDFGAIAGAPVLFYLGAFIYTILDLKNKPSDQDAAISLAFGVEWMIIVHVAIIAACVLASNNPSTTSVLVGQPPPETLCWLQRPTTRQILADPPPPGFWSRALAIMLRLWHGQLGPIGFLDDVYNDRYQPVTMWRRGENKREWIRATRVWNRLQRNAVNQANPAPQVDNGTSMRPRDLRVTFWRHFIFVFFATLVLINLPPAAGAVVAWRTPPIGWGCRSLTFVCYAGCQALLVVFFLGKGYFQNRLAKGIFWFLYGAFGVLSLFVALVGTLMQVIGVYRNCFCYTNANEWYNLEAAFVNVASDTQEQRHSSANWVIFGGVATVFMGLCCVIGWWYQNLIRKRYEEVVDKLWEHHDPPAPTATNCHGPRSPGDPTNSSSNCTSRRPSMAGGVPDCVAPRTPNDGIGMESGLAESSSQIPLLTPPERHDSWGSSRAHASGAVPRQRPNATQPAMELQDLNRGSSR